jgi:hypothetical protein
LGAGGAIFSAVTIAGAIAAGGGHGGFTDAILARLIGVARTILGTSRAVFVAIALVIAASGFFNDFTSVFDALGTIGARAIKGTSGAIFIAFAGADTSAGGGCRTEADAIIADDIAAFSSGAGDRGGTAAVKDASICGDIALAAA